MIKPLFFFESVLAILGMSIPPRLCPRMKIFLASIDFVFRSRSENRETIDPVGQRARAVRTDQQRDSCTQWSALAAYRIGVRQ